jgi:hypothetical protein
LNFTEFLETATFYAHLLELLHDVNVVGNEGWTKTFGDHFVTVNRGAVTNGFLPLNDIVFDYLNLFQTLFLVKTLQELFKFNELMNYFVRLTVVKNC